MGNSAQSKSLRIDQQYNLLMNKLRAQLLDLTKNQLEVEQLITRLKKKAETHIARDNIKEARICVHDMQLNLARSQEMASMCLKLRTMLNDATNAKNNNVLTKYMQSMNQFNQEIQALQSPISVAQTVELYQQQRVETELRKDQIQAALLPKNNDIYLKVEEELEVMIEARNLQTIKNMQSVPVHVQPSAPSNVVVVSRDDFDELEHRLVLLNTSLSDRAQ